MGFPRLKAREEVKSLQTTTIGASQVVGPLVFTALADAAGYQTALLGAGGAAAVVVALGAVVPVAS